MRLLIFHVDRFDWEVQQTSSPSASGEAIGQCGQLRDALVAFIHCEPADQNREAALTDQAVKYFRWLSRKRQCETLALHSFAHLAEERSSATFARRLLTTLEESLCAHGLRCTQTPFGYALQWEIAARGHPYAKTFKQL